eukprot:COSAG04_NODE_1883_length_5310_cov_658.662637_8_plen_66_part_00
MEGALEGALEEQGPCDSTAASSSELGVAAGVEGDRPEPDKLRLHDVPLLIVRRRQDARRARDDKV